jgi:flagellar protein FliS
MTSAASARATITVSALSPRKAGLAVEHYRAWTLMDKVLEHIGAARDRDTQGKATESRPLLQSAVRIIRELQAALDLHDGGAIAANVDDLYDYMCRRLQAAALHKEVAALDEVMHLLHALRSAWAFMPPEVRSA